jgi:ketosteroid isomerase-like protein
MKRLALCVVFISIFAFSVFGQKAAAAAKTDPSKGVREAFDRLIEGIKQVDAAKVMSVYAKSDNTLFFNNNGSITTGWETMKTNRESSYPKIKDVTLDITRLKVELLSKTAAYVSCKWKQSQVFDGKLENASGRMTLVFKLIGKDWKAVHLHTSPDNIQGTRPLLDSEKEKPTN